jgi:hypothetical protein
LAQPLGLGATHLPSSSPSAVLHLSFVFLILFLLYKIFEGIKVSDHSTLSGLSLPSLPQQGFGSGVGFVPPDMPPSGCFTAVSRRPNA